MLKSLYSESKFVQVFNTVYIVYDLQTSPVFFIKNYSIMGPKKISNVEKASEDCLIVSVVLLGVECACSQKCRYWRHFSTSSSSMGMLTRFNMVTGLGAKVLAFVF